MLAVHWAPVSRTKHILRNGIIKSPKRIIKVMPQGDEFGRVQRLKKKSMKYRYTNEDKH